MRIPVLCMAGCAQASDFNGADPGLFKTDDGGQTWQELPGLRSMKARPPTTDQAARDSIGMGIRLTAALPIGWTISPSSEVIARGK